MERQNKNGVALFTVTAGAYKTSSGRNYALIRNAEGTFPSIKTAN